ncbi:MAG: hypothetical protein IT208_05065 [Chthonomonadales bacterium]|nr:hypothetical protein [Chthonomonadales bacterium]
MRYLSAMAPVLWAALAVLCPAVARAQRRPSVTVVFTMPQGADPTAYYFDHSGQTIEIPGAVLLPAVQGGGGAELHSGDPLLLFDHLSLLVGYEGGVELATRVAEGFPQLAWGFSPSGVVPFGGTAEMWAGPNSARIGQLTEVNQRLYGVLAVPEIGVDDVEAFRRSTFLLTATASTVPEPGFLVLLGGLGGAALPLVVRRRRQRAIR